MESGVALEHPSIQAFRQAVLGGDWRNAERLLLDGLKAGRRAGVPAAQNGTGANGTSANGNGELHNNSMPSVFGHQSQVEGMLRSPETKGWDVSALRVNAFLRSVAC